MAQDFPYSGPPTPLLPQDPPVPLGPIVLLPQNQTRGCVPAENMLSTDLRMQTKIPFGGMPTADQWHPPMALPAYDPTSLAPVADASGFAQQSPANLMVPTPPAAAPEEEEQVWEFSGPSASISTKDVGVRTGSQRSVREYLASGYTRRNPDGTDWSDDDWAGKWDDAEFSIASVEGSTEFFDVSVADGEFGDEDSLFSGSGRVLGADSDASAKFELTNRGLQGEAGAQVSGSVLEGKIESDDSQIAAGSAEGSVLSGEAEAKVEAKLTADEVTLSGELGAEVNLIEGSLGGDLYITPRRVVNPGINLWNYMMGDDVEPLSENWDVGIMVGGEVSGQIGAQAKAGAGATYENGRAVAEAEAKIGLGIGAGVKARGGLVGLDTLWDNISGAIWD